MITSRLSPYNIADTLRRAELYREIRNGNPDWDDYDIQPDETLSPELIAYRKYGTDELKWVVLVVTGLDDMREAITAGETIKLPPVTWLRQRIKHYGEK